MQILKKHLPVGTEDKFALDTGHKLNLHKPSNFFQEWKKFILDTGHKLNLYRRPEDVKERKQIYFGHRT